MVDTASLLIVDINIPDLGFGDRSWIDFSPYDIFHDSGVYPSMEISHDTKPNNRPHLAPAPKYKPKSNAVRRPHASPSYRPHRKPSYRPHRKPVQTPRPKSQYSPRPKPAYTHRPAPVSRPQRKSSHHPNRFRYTPRKSARTHYYVTERKLTVLPKGTTYCPQSVGDRKSTRLNSSHVRTSRMPSSA